MADEGPRRRDGLLTTTKFALVFVKVAIGIGIAAVLSALPAILFNQEMIAAELVKDGKSVAIGEFVGSVSVLLPMVAALLALAFWFVHMLGRIVDTVGDGDPFIPANADRLRTMAWVALTIQLATLPIGATALWVTRQVKDNPSNLDFDLSFTGLVLVLILFILARVFRRGAEMREELEGTV